jgi:Family of unknown function (DUF6011)
MAHSHQLTDPAAVTRFILAGNATFTLVSKKSGARFTYRVRVAENNATMFFVSVLTGSDNEGSFSYLGYIRREVYFHGTAKSKIGQDAPSARAFAWFYKLIAAAKAPLGQLEFWHEGKCCRCGRKLTVPASIESGIGPECAGRLAPSLRCVQEAVTTQLRGGAAIRPSYKSAYGKAGDPFPFNDAIPFGNA